MAYVKTNWQTGDVITAAKLNNMETGIYDATEAAAAAFAPDIDDPQDGDVIKYDSTEGKWINGAGPAGDFAPDIDDPQDGDVIKYDSTAEKWVNGAAGVFPIEAEINAGTQAMSLTKTWQDIYDAAAAGKLCLIYTANSALSMAINLYVAMVALQNESYNVLAIMAQSSSVSAITFSAGTASGYPTQVI